MSTTINIKDNANIRDCGVTVGDHIRHRMSGGPVKTRIVITDHNTGEVLGEISNKILVPGSMITAAKQFGVEYPKIQFPTYDDTLALDNRYVPWDWDEHGPEDGLNSIMTCLWCAGRSGSGSSPNEVSIVKNTDKIRENNDILPFRYIEMGDQDKDITTEEREVYFGRKTFTDTSGKNVHAYYFKKFDTEPQLNIKYIDGTDVQANMWSDPLDQAVEIYIEMRLAMSRVDFREYFTSKGDWEDADISTISLVTAWYDVIPDDPTHPLGAPTYKYYHDILPFSKFNFRAEKLDDKTRAIDFNYQIFY